MPLCHLTQADLFYDDKGQGEPLLFLNGLSGDHLYWRRQLRTFGKEYRCLAVDNRDVGQSSYAAGPYSARDLAGDVLELFDRLALPPAHVVGLSMGGLIAQELALTAPRRVKSLVLVDTLAHSDEWFRGLLHAFELIRRQVADTPAFFEAILPWWVSPRSSTNRIASAGCALFGRTPIRSGWTASSGSWTCSADTTRGAGWPTSPVRCWCSSAKTTAWPQSVTAGRSSN